MFLIIISSSSSSSSRSKSRSSSISIRSSSSNSSGSGSSSSSSSSSRSTTSTTTTSLCLHMPISTHVTDALYLHKGVCITNPCLQLKLASLSLRLSPYRSLMLHLCKLRFLTWDSIGPAASHDMYTVPFTKRSEQNGDGPHSGVRQLLQTISRLPFLIHPCNTSSTTSWSQRTPDN